MAYFQRSPSGEEKYARKFVSGSDQEPDPGWEEEEEYDDGFDELDEEEPGEEASEEELLKDRQRRFRLAAGFGDLGATLIGVTVILILIAFLISMIRFLITDFTQNYSLFQTRF